MQNGVCETFNGRMRDELLNETLFFDQAHARVALSRWVADSNQHRPHSALRYQTPAAYTATFTATGGPAEQPRPAPPIARCSRRALAPLLPRDSGLNRMKTGVRSISTAAVPRKAAEKPLQHRHFLGLANRPVNGIFNPDKVSIENMASALVRYELNDGRSILVEAEPETVQAGPKSRAKQTSGFERASADKKRKAEGYERASIADAIAIAPKKLQEALASVGATAELVFEQVSSISKPPKETTIELSVKFTVKGDVIIAKGEAEGNCKLVLKW